MLVAVHRQEARRATTLGRAARSPNREKTGVKSLRVGQNLLVEFGTEQKDDTLSGLFNCGNRPVELVETTEITEKVA
jgi:hypothetical protein